MCGLSFWRHAGRGSSCCVATREIVLVAKRSWPAVSADARANSSWHSPSAFSSCFHYSSSQVRFSSSTEVTGDTAHKSASRALAPAAPPPTIFDPPTIRRPGDTVAIGTVIRNWWAFPAVGFNSVLEMPVEKFEMFEPDGCQPAGSVVVPNSIFGVPLRKDLVYKVYWYHRRWLAGFDNTHQLYKWEWPGSNKKVRSQKKSGKSRMGRRKAPGKFEGVFSTALRPKDWRQRRGRRLVWKTLKVMLSVKFAQNSIKVVDSFNLRSHKTKYLVQHLRRVLGRKCHSAMLVHEGTIDVNDNFRWASAHIASIRRENVEGVSVYNLLKYHEVVFTEAALIKLIQSIQTYPQQRGWAAKYATPDGKPASPPEKVAGWNKTWIEKKERLRTTEHRLREFYQDQQKWKWSPELKGPLKVPRNDPLSGFRVKDFIMNSEKPIWEKLETLYIDDEPLEEEPEDDEFADLLETMDASVQKDDTNRSILIEDPAEIEGMSLGALAHGGRKSSRSSGSDATQLQKQAGESSTKSE